MILRAPERRFRDRLLRQHPVLMEAELDDYAKVDRRVELGASCGACGRPLAYPLVQLPCGGRAAPLLHPGCAVAVAEGMLRDAREIEEERQTIGPMRHEDAMSLYLAALSGARDLAEQMERMGLTGGDDSIEDAQGLRPEILARAEEAWGG